MRLIVAVAAPVSMLVEPGPMEAVHARVARRKFALANRFAVDLGDFHERFSPATFKGRAYNQSRRRAIERRYRPTSCSI